MPDIHIPAALRDGMWQVAVEDNGIGIPREYYSRIFILFERLHRRERLSGDRAWARVMEADYRAA